MAKRSKQNATVSPSTTDATVSPSTTDATVSPSTTLDVTSNDGCMDACNRVPVLDTTTPFLFNPDDYSDEGALFSACFDADCVGGNISLRTALTVGFALQTQIDRDLKDVSVTNAVKTRAATVLRFEKFYTSQGRNGQASERLRVLHAFRFLSLETQAAIVQPTSTITPTMLRNMATSGLEHNRRTDAYTLKEDVSATFYDSVIRAVSDKLLIGREADTFISDSLKSGKLGQAKKLTEAEENAKRDDAINALFKRFGDAIKELNVDECTTVQRLTSRGIIIAGIPDILRVDAATTSKDSSLEFAKRLEAANNIDAIEAILSVLNPYASGILNNHKASHSPNQHLNDSPNLKIA